MAEHAVTFAPHSLVGVLADSATQDGARRPAVVFLNAGMLHRVGPNRLHVRLARELARRGFTSLRFDRSGVGDSPPRKDGLPLREAGLSDVRDAMDFLAEERGASAFILVGLCSGADLAFSAALADERIAGAILIDGLPYRSWRSRLHRFASRLTRRGAWRRLLARDGPLWRRLRRVRQPARPAVAARQREVPSQEEAAAGLRSLTERGMRLLLIYTHGREYSYRRQFRDMFPGIRADRVDVEFFRDADHTFTLGASQDLLARRVDQWMSRFQRT
jgi:pimeloyl-ACP methyl ester carboxylesterase